MEGLELRFASAGLNHLKISCLIWGRVQKNIHLIELIRLLDILLKTADGHLKKHSRTTEQTIILLLQTEKQKP